jgi:HAD superfamily hydrolase (TIGR01549 family)
LNFVWIFDLDGTLFASHEQIFAAVSETLDSRRIQVPAQTEIFNLIGRPAEELFIGFVGESVPIDELVAEFRQSLELKLQLGTPLYPGTEDFLKELKQHEQKVAIATMKPDYLARRMVELSPIRNLIDYVQGSTDLAPKPNPAVINRSMSELDADKGVMIGDRLEDIVCARNAGIKSIGLAQTTVSQESFIVNGANFAFSGMKDLVGKSNLILRALS